MRRVAMVFVMGLLLAGCGGEEEEPAATPTQDGQVETAPAGGEDMETDDMETTAPAGGDDMGATTAPGADDMGATTGPGADDMEMTTAP